MGSRGSLFGQNGAESGLGLSREFGGKFVLRSAVLPGGDELWDHGKRGHRRLDEGSGAEENPRVYGAGPTWMGNGVHQGSVVQLDGDAGGGSGDGFALDDRESGGDVAADHDVFCAWV